MFEKEPKWSLHIPAYGAQEYDELAEMLGELAEVNQVREHHVCEDCNFPGGGRNHEPRVLDANGNLVTDRDWWEPEDFAGVTESTVTVQDTPCAQTNDEKACCPKIYSFYRDFLCTTGRCDSMKCPRCKGRARVGKLRIGDVLMVSGIACSFMPNNDGTVSATMIPSQRCGRFLGGDIAGLLRFELMKAEGGDGQSTGMRFWLTPSGYFMEDLTPEAKEALSTIKTPGEPKIWKPGDDPNV